MITNQCTSSDIADTYRLYTASAPAVCAFLRSLLAFVFPLLVPSLFGTLGYGWGASVLSLVAIVIGIPAPLFLWFRGSRLRGVSQFVRKSSLEKA